MNPPSTPAASPSPWLKVTAIVAGVFGIMTIFSGGSVLFGPSEAREAAGNYVGLVLWFNFLAGWFYVLAAIGLWLGRYWAVRLAALIAIATSLIALGFLGMVLSGSAYEMRTVLALTLRISVWAVVAILARRWIRPA